MNKFLTKVIQWYLQPLGFIFKYFISPSGKPGRNLKSKDVSKIKAFVSAQIQCMVLYKRYPGISAWLSTHEASSASDFIQHNVPKSKHDGQCVVSTQYTHGESKHE